MLAGGAAVAVLAAAAALLAAAAAAGAAACAQNPASSTRPSSEPELLHVQAQHRDDTWQVTRLCAEMTSGGLFPEPHS